MRALRERIDRIVAWWKATRAGRALLRFGAEGGGVLTGGIAYSTLFSVFSALTLGWTIFAALLGEREALRAQVVTTLDSALPGLIDTGDGKGGLISLDQLQLSTGVSIAGGGAIVILVVSAIAAMTALRRSVRVMLGSQGKPNMVGGKLRDLAGLVGLALAVLVSAVVTLLLSTATDWLAGLIGYPGLAGSITRVLGIVVAFILDALTFLLVVRVLAGEKPPWRDLLGGAVLAGIGLGVLRLLGATVVSGSLRHNKALAPFAVLVVLLAWVNLVARIVLMAAAWTADPPPPDAQQQASPAERTPRAALAEIPSDDEQAARSAERPG